MNISIDTNNYENIINFKKILKKDESTMINEALERYFDTENRKLLEKNLENENTMTNLDFDEFWNDVELDT